MQYNIDIYNMHVVSQRPKSEAQVVARGLGGKVGLKGTLHSVEKTLIQKAYCVYYYILKERRFFYVLKEANSKLLRISRGSAIFKGLHN